MHTPHVCGCESELFMDFPYLRYVIRHVMHYSSWVLKVATNNKTSRFRFLELCNLYVGFSVLLPSNPQHTCHLYENLRKTNYFTLPKIIS
jgi:hypothetical protein